MRTPEENRNIDLRMAQSNETFRAVTAIVYGGALPPDQANALMVAIRAHLNAQEAFLAAIWKFPTLAASP